MRTEPESRPPESGSDVNHLVRALGAATETKAEQSGTGEAREFAVLSVTQYYDTERMLFCVVLDRHLRGITHG